ncbi:hypothetical protein HZI73_05845 [Vallitalea pronyensis]|uniref:Uncharacterized protein n=1 Tax=Vallitalea pronyensis TaxID=1348613 RepID=A0A8J8MHR2_9FIRM|nr:hypothetical protein [Vallitalea pronyensis]QUI21849.1 hypothetical protein HZI73_05845 [Vallitalea pronyensis]
MIFDKKQDTFNTFAEWYVWGMGTFMSPLYKVVPKALVEGDVENFLEAEEDFYHFLKNMFQDMYKQPEKYNLPLEPFIRHDQFSKKRLNVRRVARNGILDFLFQIGQVGILDGERFMISQGVWYELLLHKNKIIKSKDGFLSIIEQLGFYVEEGQEVIINHTKYPKMLWALCYFSKACAKDKKNSLRHFCRCDFRLFENHPLGFEDVLELLPESLGDEVIHTDRILTTLKYRRKIEYYDDHGYRIAYSNKAGVVFYCHVHSYKTKNYHHYMRWVLNTSQTTSLFQQLIEDNQEEIVNYICHHLHRCDPNCNPGYGASSPESCMARIKVNWDNQLLYTCKDKGCNIGSGPTDFKYLRILLEATKKIVYADSNKTRNKKQK